MKHTDLTVRNFGSLSTTVFMISLLSVGFGTVDLLFVAPQGETHVAAVGQGAVIVSAVITFFGGVVDVFSSRLSIAEGAGRRSQQLPVLLGALVLLLIASELLGVLLSLGVSPFLSWTGQPAEVVPLVTDYIRIHLWSVALVVGYSAVMAALKICGLKNYSLAVLTIGFGANVLLDWLFLYTAVADRFPSPEYAVSMATVVVDVVMGVLGIAVFRWQARRQNYRFARPGGTEVAAEARSMARVSCGIGIRHLNDWMGAVVPTLFIGSLGVGALAATAVATRLYTLFCRVPQACVSGAFVFYGYAVGGDTGQLRSTARRLLRYAAIPTAVAALLVVLFSRDLVALFGDGRLDENAARRLLFAYLVFLPVYLPGAVFGEMLTVHQRAGLLFWGSTIATYAIIIPLSWYGVFVLDSAVFAVAAGGLPNLVLAPLFWRALRRRHWAEPAVTDTGVRVA